MLHHIIRCINKYPVCISDSPINRQRFYSGVHHIDEICCKTGLTPNKIQEDIERDPFVVTICKWFKHIWILFEDFIWLIRSGCNLIVIISYSNLRSIYLLVIFFTRKKKQILKMKQECWAGFALNFIEFLIYIKKNGCKYIRLKNIHDLVKSVKNWEHFLLFVILIDILKI